MARRLPEDDLFQSDYGLLFSLAGGQNTKTRFDNDKTGFRLATSVEGGTTGEGGEVIVADGPHNLQEADSKDTLVRRRVLFPASLDPLARWPRAG